jgi:cysteine-rich repeat protein
VVFDVASGGVIAYLNDPSRMGGAIAATRNEVYIQAYRPRPLGYVVLRYASTCGNGVVDADELCDDGNLVAGDGCTPDCRPSGFACRDDVGITRATLAIRTPAAGHGGGSFIATGRLDGMAEAGLVMTSVVAGGARVRVRDVEGHALLDLTDLGTPIPGGREGCGPRDGWRSDAGRHRAVYTNRSGALPPSCAPGSAQGLRRLALHRGISRQRIDIHLKVARGAFPPPVFPLDLIVHVGGLGDDVTTACGSHRFDGGDCHGDASDEALFCRDR